MRLKPLALCFLLALFVPAAVIAAGRDGRIFDPGATMTAPADRASAESAALTPLIGEYDVHFSWFEADSLAHESDGVASLRFMNRGHALLERFHCADFDGQGHQLSTISFLMHTPSSGKWVYAIADSYRENIRSFDGRLGEGAWEFETVLRARGGANLVHHRVRVLAKESDGLSMEASRAVDGKNWQRVWTREYRRRDSMASVLVPREDFGEPAPGLPDEAREFDFLVGDWDTAHDLKRPDGNSIQFPVRGTAVHAMNGHAIMEYLWNEVDPNVPDAATTIVRIYNRAMRRWESMYSTNRFNGILYFGGVREGDKIVLHPFEADSSESPISYWTFHDMNENDYGWYANTSRDRGENFTKTWIIQATRR